MSKNEAASSQPPEHAGSYLIQITKFRHKEGEN
jgi:hypothetical protein